jgi:nucleoside-diphosphate-sugar epimerase
MRCFVSGATGFIGSHLLQRLVAADIATAILIRSASNTWRIQDLLPRVVQIEGDLKDLSAAECEIKSFAPDTIIHLGWHGVGNRYRNDPLQIDYNIPSSSALLHLAHRIGVKTWIGLGSQAEYGPSNRQIGEETPTKPTTLYGVAKLCVCLIAQHLCSQFNMRFIWLRLFSSYGPMDEQGWLIPSIILSLLRGERPSLTEGVQRWDYLYVTDVAEAIYQVVVTPNAHGIFNLGSGQAHMVRSIAERIRDLIDPSAPLGFGEVLYRPHQIMHLQADLTRLQQATGWKPKIMLDEGLRHTVEWFRENRWRYE